MTVVETLLTFVVAPGVVYGGVALWAGAGRRSRRARYKAGDAWPYEPLFWIANPQGANLPDAHDAHGPAAITAPAAGGGTDTRGGTGGKW